MRSQEVVTETGRFGDEINLKIKTPSTKYLDEFIKLRCAPTLLQAGYFPNAKEITESIGGFRAVQNILQDQFSNPRVGAIVVGDGHTPRTGAMIAVRTRWTVYSIDPSASHVGDLTIKNLKVVKSRVEEFIPPRDIDIAVIVGVHSHGPIHGLWHFYESLGIARIAVAIPCCVELGTGMPYPDQDYQDYGIWSPERRVLVWLSKELQHVPSPVQEGRKRSELHSTEDAGSNRIMPQAS